MGAAWARHAMCESAFNAYPERKWYYLRERRLYMDQSVKLKLDEEERSVMIGR
jgi:hypothetical protein